MMDENMMEQHAKMKEMMESMMSMMTEMQGMMDSMVGGEEAPVDENAQEDVQEGGISEADAAKKKEYLSKPPAIREEIDRKEVMNRKPPMKKKMGMQPGA